MPILDIDIYRSNSIFTTSVYRKPSFIGLLTYFHSFISLSYKRNLVFDLSHRIFNLCFSYKSFHAQIETTKKLFKLNCYPTHMFDRIIHCFFDMKFEQTSSFFSVPKKMMYLCLPFTDLQAVTSCKSTHKSIVSAMLSFILM